MLEQSSDLRANTDPCEKRFEKKWLRLRAATFKFLINISMVLARAKGCTGTSNIKQEQPETRTLKKSCQARTATSPKAQCCK